MDRTVLFLIWLLLLLPCSIPPAAAQTGMDRFGSARAAALALATTADRFDTGLHVNPAIPAAQQASSATLFGRQAFGLAELRLGTFSVTQPVPGATLHAGSGTFGFDAYRETFFSLSAARGLSLGTSRTLFAGLGARYHHVHVQGFGASSAASLHGGLLVPVLASLTAGLHAHNLTGSSIGGEPLPRSLAVGMHYQPTSHVNVYADIYKDVAFPWSLRGGLEVSPVPVLSLRVGAACHPARLAVGAGVHAASLRVDIAAERHPTLGWSPSGGLTIRW